jgi:hypothetical protein
MKRHDPQARAALLAAQEALKSSERLVKTDGGNTLYDSEEDFQQQLKERGINPDCTKNPAVRTMNEIMGLWPMDKSHTFLEQPKIVAVDLDGTILDSKDKQLGKPIPGVRKKLQRLKALGWAIVIWTVRQEAIDIVAHLTKHEIPFDYFNWHPWQPKGTSVKIKADVYIDDRAVSFKGNASDFDQVILHRPWWKKDG